MIECSTPGCPRLLDPELPGSFYRKVEGWERAREQGGTNHVALRRPLNEYRCLECVQREQAKINAGQGSLL